MVAVARRLDRSVVGQESEDGVAKPNPLDGAKEIQAMLVDYAKQETIDPLKSLGRFIGLGMAGALMVFLGVFFLGMGVLRLMQTVMDGNQIGSTVAYLVSIVALAAAMGIIFSLYSRSKKRVLS